MAVRVHLAIVIVSYNTCNLLRACLRSVVDASVHTRGWMETNLIVVDNASSDGSAAMVAREFPQVQLEALAENLGFTGGNNHAFAQLGLLDAPGAAPAPDYVLMLNPDTLVDTDAIAHMVRFMQATPAAGICGANLRYADGRFQDGAFVFPGLAQVALDLLPLQHLPLAQRVYASPINGRYPQPVWQAGAPFTVDFVLGAALMARAEVIRSLHGLDDAYFMYCEEVDFCLRAAEAGWVVYAVPAATIVHVEGQSSRQVRWPAFARLWRSRMRFYSLHRNHFAPCTTPAVRLLTRAAMLCGTRRAFMRFATGGATGDEAGAEIAARRAVLRAIARPQ